MPHWEEMSQNWQDAMDTNLLDGRLEFMFVPEGIWLSDYLTEMGDLVRGADIKSDDWLAEELRLYLDDAIYSYISPYLTTDTESLLRAQFSLYMGLVQTYHLGYWRLQKRSAQRTTGRFSVAFDSLLKRLTETYARATIRTLYNVALPDKDGNILEQVKIGDSVSGFAPMSQRLTVRFVTSSKYTVYSDLYGQLYTGNTGFTDYFDVAGVSTWWYFGAEGSRSKVAWIQTPTTLRCKVGTYVEIEAEYQSASDVTARSPLDEVKNLLDRAISHSDFNSNFTLTYDGTERINQQMFSAFVKETGPSDIMTIIKNLVAPLGMSLIDRPGDQSNQPGLRAIPLHGLRTPGTLYDITTDDVAMEAVQEGEPLGGYTSVVVRGRRNDGSEFITGYPSSSAMGLNPYRFESDYFREGTCEALAEHLYKILHPRTPIYKLPGNFKLVTLEPGEIYNVTLDAPLSLTDRKMLVFKKVIRGMRFDNKAGPKNPVEIHCLDVTDWVRADQDVAGTSTFGDTPPDHIW